MSIGYACLIVGGLGTKLRTCREKNATYKVLSDLISSNLAALDTMDCQPFLRHLFLGH